MSGSITSGLIVSPTPHQTLPAAAPAYAGAFDETAILRRRLTAMAAEITQSRLNDSITQRIAQWRTLFDQAMQQREVNTTSVLNRFIPLLQEILIDPLGGPLDELSFLGTDGETYGYRTLNAFVNTHPEPYRSRSPLYQQNPAIFRRKPHPVVRHMVRWLIERNAQLPANPAVEAEIKALQQRNIPLFDRDEDTNTPEGKANEDRRARVRQIAAIQANRDQRPVDIFNNTLNTVRVQTTTNIREAEAQQKRAINAHAEAVQKQLKAIDERNKKKIAELESAIKKLECKAEEQERRQQELENQLKQTRAQLDESKRKEIEMELSILQLQKDINKQKSNWLRTVCEVVVVVGICIVVNWVLLETGVTLLPGNGLLNLNVPWG